MSRLLNAPLLSISLCGLMFGAACDSSSGTKNDAAVLNKQADDKDAAKKKEKEDRAEQAKTDAAEKKVEEAEREKLYEAAKPTLEPFAKLPKKHPKGFANACIEMLAEYDIFMKKSLSDKALAGWDAAKDNRERVMRRACHLRPVEAVVCETAVLKKAPDKAQLAHIMRLCNEKFE